MIPEAGMGLGWLRSGVSSNPSSPITSANIGTGGFSYGTGIDVGLGRQISALTDDGIPGSGAGATVNNAITLCVLGAFGPQQNASKININNDLGFGGVFTGEYGLMMERDALSRALGIERYGENNEKVLDTMEQSVQLCSLTSFEGHVRLRLGGLVTAKSVKYLGNYIV